MFAHAWQAVHIQKAENFIIILDLRYTLKISLH